MGRVEAVNLVVTAAAQTATHADYQPVARTIALPDARLIR